MPLQLIGAATSAGGNVLSSILGNKAAKAQGAAQLYGSQAANDLLRDQNNQNRADLAPWTNAGGDAMRRISFLLGLTGTPQDGGTQQGGPNPNQAKITQLGYDISFLEKVLSGQNPTGNDGKVQDAPKNPATIQKYQALLNQKRSERDGLVNSFQSSQRESNPNLYKPFETDPGYEFRLGEGLKAVQRSAASKGSLDSGGTLKALTRYGQDYGSTEFSNIINRLLGTAGLGQNSVSQQVNTGTGIAGQQANNRYQAISNAGDAQAAGYASTANGVNGILDAANWYLRSRAGRGGSAPSASGFPVNAGNGPGSLDWLNSFKFS